MKKCLFIVILSLLFIACSDTSDKIESENKATAEHFFRGIYGCDPSVVDSLADDSIVVSYPIFKKLYNTYTFRGRKTVKRFAERFCSRWSDAEFTFHNAIAEGNNVVLLWSFRARYVGSDSSQFSPPIDQEQSWGGITLYRFNEAGKIVAEIGEESVPGPIERLAIK